MLSLPCKTCRYLQQGFILAMPVVQAPAPLLTRATVAAKSDYHTQSVLRVLRVLRVCNVCVCIYIYIYISKYIYT